MVTPKYKPVDYSDESKTLNIETTVVQAAQALDVAGVIAAKTENLEALVGIAAMWVSIGEKLLESGESDKEEQEEKVMGFHNNLGDDEQETMIIHGKLID